MLDFCCYDKSCKCPTWELSLCGYICLRSTISVSACSFPHTFLTLPVPSLNLSPVSSLLSPMSIPLTTFSSPFCLLSLSSLFLTFIHSTVCRTLCQAPVLSPALHFTFIGFLWNDTANWQLDKYNADCGSCGYWERWQEYRNLLFTVCLFFIWWEGPGLITDTGEHDPTHFVDAQY